MIQAVIFDFFDVIHADPQKAWLKAHGYKREGAFAEASDLLDLGEITYDEYISRYAGHSGKTEKEVDTSFKSFARLDRGVVRIIKALKQEGVVTALVSNANAAEVRPLLTKHKLTFLFDDIIISSEVGIRKPDPKIFQIALERMNLAPHEVIFIDDTKHNVAAARDCGMHAIHHCSSDQLLLALRAKQVDLQV